MYKQGSRVAYARFNASGTDSMDWLNATRLIDSSWTDIQSYTSADKVMASVEGFFRYPCNQFKTNIMQAHLYKKRCNIEIESLN